MLPQESARVYFGHRSVSFQGRVSGWERVVVAVCACSQRRVVV